MALRIEINYYLYLIGQDRPDYNDIKYNHVYPDYISLSRRERGSYFAANLPPLTPGEGEKGGEVDPGEGEKGGEVEFTETSVP
jgi:hypothetical protein